MSPALQYKEPEWLTVLLQIQEKADFSLAIEGGKKKKKLSGIFCSSCKYVAGNVNWAFLAGNFFLMFMGQVVRHEQQGQTTFLQQVTYIFTCRDPSYFALWSPYACVCLLSKILNELLNDLQSNECVLYLDEKDVLFCFFLLYPVMIIQVLTLLCNDRNQPPLTLFTFSRRKWNQLK